VDARRRTKAYRALLILVGAWVGHELAYLVAHPDPLVRAVSLGGHAYLDLARALVTPLGAVALARLAVVRSREPGPGARLSPTRLALWQMALFLAVEVVERIPQGRLGEVFNEPAILVGTALMLPISALMVWTVKTAAALVSAFRPTGEPHQGTEPPRLWVPVMSVLHRDMVLLSAQPRRGPPVTA
jgi:hypothetical protein